MLNHVHEYLIFSIKENAGYAMLNRWEPFKNFSSNSLIPLNDHRTFTRDVFEIRIHFARPDRSDKMR